MNNYSGIITGLLSFAVLSANAAGKPALAVVFSDPVLATAITTIVGAVLAIVAGALPGAKKPEQAQ